MDKQHRPAHSGSGRMWAGIIIVAIGAILLAGRLDMDWLIPGWLISWPMVVIVIGLIIGGKSNFRNPASLIILGIGLFFLIQRITHFNMTPFLWPLIIIGIGLWLLLDKRKGYRDWHGPHNDFERGRRTDDYEWDKRVSDEDNTGSPAQNGATAGFGGEADGGEDRAFTGDDYLKSTAVFSEVKKIIISKDFRGGEIVNIFGGTNINLIQADIQSPIVIDVFQLFAGTKIIVPAHWKIKSEVTSVFGEVDDRRFVQGIPQDEQKTVYVRGTSIFGGITIKSI